MKTAFFILTGRCTRRCRFCFYRTGYLPPPGKELTLSEIGRSLKKLRRLGVTDLILTGGDPLCRDDITFICARAGETSFRRLLLTNGDLLTTEKLAELLATGLEGISVSVHSFDDMVKMEELGPVFSTHPTVKITVTTVFTGRNLAELESIYRRVRAAGWFMIFQPAFLPHGHPEERFLSPRMFSGTQWERVEEILGRWREDAGVQNYHDYIRGVYARGGRRPGGCVMGSKALVVDSDGSVYPCFHRRDLFAGNITADPAARIQRELDTAAEEISPAPCYGEHCVSLFID